MNIIITLAGHSRRFGVDKSFLDLGRKTIIENVVEMFSPQDLYTFIINENQKKYLKFLEGIRPNSKVIVIRPHEKGPVYSVRQVPNIADDEEVLISYCDFLLEWNYKDFLLKARNFDGAIPVFKDFHPASLGDTRYAYVREKENIFLEIKEKESFSSNHLEEPASAGIYYFSKFSTFKKYADQLLTEDKETYVSLIYNLMQKDGLKTLISEVSKFICLGTPRDYFQFKDWANYFSGKFIENKNIYKDQINLIPMAGKGKRFSDVGFKIKKPFIPVGNLPMAQRSFKSLPRSNDWIVIHSREDSVEDLGDEHFKFLSLPKESSSMGETCLYAKNYLKEDKSLFISSCDYETYFDEKKWQKVIDNPDIDGAIWSFKYRHHVVKDPQNFAYLNLDGNRVKRIVEKKILSDNPSEDPLVVGCFWYRKSSDFVKGMETLISRGEKVNNEYFVGTSINNLIEKGKTFVNFEIDFWVSFGDPFELKVYEYWEDFFKNGKLCSDSKREWEFTLRA